MASNSERRLDRLLIALTPKERAILMLRAWKAGREPGARLLASGSEQEAYEFNRLNDLLQVSTGDATQYLLCLHLLTGQLQIKYSWFLTVILWSNESYPNERADEIADVLRKGLAEGVAACWRELGALAVLLDEIAEEFDGEDVLHPEARSLYEATKDQLRELRESVTGRGATCELIDPTGEDIDALRAKIKMPGR